MTRRTAALSLLASSAPASAKPIRAAVYGIAHAHALGKVQALRALDKFEFAGVCEPDPKVPREAKQLHGVRWLTEKELLDDASIELIAVEAGVDVNLEYAHRSIRAGKHIHLDKAPGQDMPGFRALLEEAAQKRLRVQMGYQWRYQPGMSTAIEAARKGWLGHIYGLRATINKPTPAADRKLLARFKGGMMYELGCHLIDRAVDLFGKPRRVTGILRHDAAIDDTLEDNTLAILEFDRAFAQIYIAAMQPNGGNYRTFEVLGTNGTIMVRPYSRSKLSIDLKDAAGPYAAGPHVVDAAADASPGFSPDFLDLASQIREGTAPKWSMRHDLDTQEALLKACHVL